MQGMKPAPDARDETHARASGGRRSLHPPLPSAGELTDLTMHAFTALSLHSKLLTDYTTTFAHICAELERHAAELQHHQRQLDHVAQYLHDWRHTLDADLQSVRRSLAAFHTHAPVSPHPDAPPHFPPDPARSSAPSPNHPPPEPARALGAVRHDARPTSRSVPLVTPDSADEKFPADPLGMHARSRSYPSTGGRREEVAPSIPRPYRRHDAAVQSSDARKFPHVSTDTSSLSVDADAPSTLRDPASASTASAPALARTSFELMGSPAPRRRAARSGDPGAAPPFVHARPDAACAEEPSRSPGALRALRTLESAGTAEDASTCATSVTSASSLTVTSLDVSESTGVFMCGRSGCPFTRCVRPQSPGRKDPTTARRTVPPPRVARERRQLHHGQPPPPRAADAELAPAAGRPGGESREAGGGLPPRTGAHEGRWVSGGELQSRGLLENVLGFSQSGGEERHGTVFNERTYGQVQDIMPQLFRPARVLGVHGESAAGDSWPQSPKRRPLHSTLWHGAQPGSGSSDQRR